MKPLLLALACVALLSPPPDRLAAARAKIQAGAYLEAAELLEELTAEDPDDAQAWYLLGFAFHAAGDHATALELHARAAEFAEVRPRASYNAACAAAVLGKTDEAFTWLTRAKVAGFAHHAQLMRDTDLASLRGDPRFRAFLPIGLPPTFVEPVELLLTLDGESAGDRFGWIGRNAGDADGDGVADLLISAPFKNLGVGSEGRVYLYSGKTGQELFRWDGGAGYTLGIGIESAGDVNGDGRADLLVGAAGAKGVGAAFVYSGADGSLLHAFWGARTGDNFGSKVAGCGDQNGDGLDDVIVGAPGHDTGGPEAGRAYVFSGKDGSELFTLDGEAGDGFGSAVDGCSIGEVHLLVSGALHAGPGRRGRVDVFRIHDGKPELAFRIPGREGDVNLGRMFVSVVGDVNGDGVPDVYGSDWESNAGGLRGSGRIYVHSGADGGLLHELAGEAPGDGFGIGTAEAGDVDGDGCDDLLIGAWQESSGAPSAGKCYLYSGKDGKLLETYTCTATADTFGFDTTGLGDINGDGRLDFLITSADSMVKGPQSGRVFVVSGPGPR